MARDPIEVRYESGYDALPEAIRCTLTRREWEFMTMDQKANLYEDSTEPQVIE